ncbi:MAG: TRM11 family SAM-dependent methyltransferase [Acidimicrobiales bacterium]
MAAAELRLVFDAIDLPIVSSDIERVTEGRAQLLSFACSAPEERIAATVGQLSAAAALFAVVGSDGADAKPALLRPIAIEERLVFGSELVTIQRYKGKTNERLTRTMLNTALAAAGMDPAKPAGVVLDPMCGRGTTLNWALAYGLSGIGIDADGTSLDHHAGFLKTWAKRQRLPHNFQRFRANNGEKRVATLHVATDRATLKSGGQHIETFQADGADTSLAIKRGSVDVIVTDLPYGVQHRGSGEAAGAGGPGTLELLSVVIPTWRRWLRPGGAICMAWNTKQAGRRDVSKVLAEGGFSPVTVTGGYSLRHVVDAAVDRDVIIAVR